MKKVLEVIAMDIIRLGKKIIKLFVPYGIIAIRNRNKVKSKSSFEVVLGNLKQRGVLINTVIDIGASDGRWSNDVMKIFPESKYFLIEANEFHKNGLEIFKKNNKKVEYIIAAAGDREGEIYFDNNDPFGGLAMNEKPEGNFSVVPVVTVDHYVQEKQYKGPFLLKLDTHGFEVPIINGALESLKKASIVIIEAYNFKIAKDSLLFYEMCEHMSKYGFRCSGIVDISYRPKDKFLWQMDLIFVRETREEFMDNNYL